MSPNRTCLAEGCERPPHGRGLCHKHYERARYQGNLDTFNFPVERMPAAGMTCLAEGCTRDAWAKGLCGTHLSRLKRRGTIVYVRPTAHDRFWAKVLITDTCWLWTGALNRQGYGRFENVFAHRWAFEEANGPIPPMPNGKPSPLDHLVCDNPPCVRPDHLVISTPRENNLRSSGPTGINARKTICKYGHEMTNENVYTAPNTGYRQCRACKRTLDRERRQRLRASNATH